MAKKKSNLTHLKGAGKRRAYRQSLIVSGLAFKPAKIGLLGVRKGKSRTLLTFETEETCDPAAILEFIGAVGGRELRLKIEPDCVDAEAWEGPGEILGSSLHPPKADGPDRHSFLKIQVEVASDNPETHLDLFECRLSMDGRDSWTAWVSMTLVQEDLPFDSGAGQLTDEEPLG